MIEVNEMENKNYVEEYIDWGTFWIVLHVNGRDACSYTATGLTQAFLMLAGYRAANPKRQACLLDPTGRVIA